MKKIIISQISEPQLGYSLDFQNERVKAKPFIKWAGGKWQLLPVMSRYMPPRQQIKRYFEPFLGGAAVFFYLQHPDSVLSDSNSELVELYQVVQNNVEKLIKALKFHRNEHDHFYKIRAQSPKNLSPVKRAARFIFLNKTCFNGLYRVNSKGQFNVPFGRYKNPNICDEEGLRSASLALNGVTIVQDDFEGVLAKAENNDFVYFDPPYHPVNKTSNFTSYTADKFADSEQKRLASIFESLDERGCFLMLSNSDTPLIRNLYEKFNIREIQANRAINSKADGRGKITELLVTNY